MLNAKTGIGTSCILEVSLARGDADKGCEGRFTGVIFFVEGHWVGDKRVKDRRVLVEVATINDTFGGTKPSNNEF